MTENKPASPPAKAQGPELPTKPGVWTNGEVYVEVFSGHLNSLRFHSFGYDDQLSINCLARGNWHPAGEVGEVTKQDVEGLAALGRYWEARAKNAEAELAACKETLAQLLKDQSESEDRIKALALPVLGQAKLDGGGYFVNNEQVVETLVVALRELQEARKPNPKYLNVPHDAAIQASFRHADGAEE